MAARFRRRRARAATDPAAAGRGTVDFRPSCGAKPVKAVSRAAALGCGAGPAWRGVVRLLSRLNALRSGEDGEPIQNFRSFTATTTYHVYDDYLRQKYPRRSQLKKQLSYLQMDARPRFCHLGGRKGPTSCGFVSWRDHSPCPGRTRQDDELARGSARLWQAFVAPGDEPTPAPRNGSQRCSTPWAARSRPTTWFGRSRELWGIKDVIQVSPERETEVVDLLDAAVDPREDRVATEVEQRDYLRRLWVITWVDSASVCSPAPQPEGTQLDAA